MLKNNYLKDKKVSLNSSKDLQIILVIDKDKNMKNTKSKDMQIILVIDKDKNTKNTKVTV